MQNTADLPPVAERDIKPDNAPQLALVRSSPFDQIFDLAKYMDALGVVTEQLSKSTIIPRSMQNPANLKLVLLQGLELGFTPIQAIRASFVIETKSEGAKVGYYVDSLVALVRRSKVCRFFRVDVTTAQKCQVTCARTDEDDAIVHMFELTMQQALEAGLDKKNEWDADARKLVQKQKYVWKTAPADMLRARCQGRAVKSVFQDVVFGMYTGEEHEDLAAADALERAPEFQPIPTTPQPRREQAAPPAPSSSANTYAERKAERRAEDVVDAEIVEPELTPVAAASFAAERANERDESQSEGTGDHAWDAVMATVATFSGVDTRGWIPPAFMKLWNERVDAVKSREQLKPLMPWVQEMAKGAAKSKACADCAATMKESYNLAHSATRTKSEAKP